MAYVREPPFVGARSSAPAPWVPGALPRAPTIGGEKVPKAVRGTSLQTIGAKPAYESLRLCFPLFPLHLPRAAFEDHGDLAGGGVLPVLAGGQQRGGLAVDRAAGDLHVLGPHGLHEREHLLEIL